MESGGFLARCPEPCAAAADPDDGDARRGGWRAAFFLVVVGFLERIGFFGVQGNLMLYLTGPMAMSTAAAATAANAWGGTVLVLTLAGGLAADSSGLGRYRAVLVASALYLLSLGMLTASSSSMAAQRATSPPSSSAGGAVVVVFYAALYLLALAQGFHTPCAEAFGADQFEREGDDDGGGGGDARRPASRSSYFNWYHFSISWGYVISTTLLSYVDENVGWTVGFAACWATMVLYLAVFLLGTGTYRRAERPAIDGAAAARRAWTARFFFFFSRNRKDAAEQLLEPQEEVVVVVDGHGDGGRGFFLVKLLPIWLSSIVFAVVVSQVSTLFTKQSSTMDRRVGGGGGLVLPSAGLQCLVSFTYIAVLPVYDRMVVPLARRLTGGGGGITMLQRIGAGMATACLAMAVAALVEARRLRVARDAGLVDRPGATVPMGVWWLVPQHVLVGVAEVLAVIGLEEFFYDQVAGELHSVGLAVSQGVMGVGSYASGSLVAAIDWATAARSGGGESWFADDLNRAHLDYFYWLLAALAALEVAVFVYLAQRYDYKNKSKP
uniref:Major facilitator superfamily (MFS) profile domain-containing protein n=1 Tax=Oryza glumipatula TaxID=40148 RepID=A0A0E0B7V8_9ORYZ